MKVSTDSYLVNAEYENEQREREALVNEAEKLISELRSAERQDFYIGRVKVLAHGNRLYSITYSVVWFHGGLKDWEIHCADKVCKHTLGAFFSAEHDGEMPSFINLNEMKMALEEKIRDEHS